MLFEAAIHDNATHVVALQPCGLSQLRLRGAVKVQRNRTTVLKVESTPMLTQSVFVNFRPSRDIDQHGMAAPGSNADSARHAAPRRRRRTTLLLTAVKCQLFGAR